jgi:Tfp pilus assembly protein PilN
MIKINLLERKSRFETLFSHFNFFILEIFILLLVIVGVISIMYFMNKNLSVQDVIISREIDALNSFLNPLQKRNAEIIRSYKDIDGMLSNINKVLYIKNKISIYYKLLVELEKSMPDDCWISSHAFSEKGNIVQLKVNALRTASVNRFVSNLTMNDFFANVKLRKVSSETEKEFDVNAFNINFNINEGA